MATNAERAAENNKLWQKLISETSTAGLTEALTEWHDRIQKKYGLDLSIHDLCMVHLWCQRHNRRIEYGPPHTQENEELQDRIIEDYVLIHTYGNLQKMVNEEPEAT